MAPPQSVQKWFTLTSHCFASFANGIGFGLYFTHVNIFSEYYNVTTTSIANTFFIGLLFEIVFCVPALKLIEWRLDYSIMCASFLTMTGYWMQYTAQSNFVVVMCCMSLQAFGQAILLPMSPYLAERWFPLHQRSIAISLGFYSNLLGYSFGAIFTTLYITSKNNILNQILVISIISTFCFIIAIILVKNKPKILLQKYKTINMKQLKQLWKYRYNTYLIVMTSVFLGLSWSFLGQMSILMSLCSPVELGILMAIWVFGGSTFGIILSPINSRMVSKSGSFTLYDRIAKLILFISLVGYVIIGLCYMYNAFSMVGYIFLVIFIGIGSIGFYGLMFMSIIETFYPLSSLLIGNIIIVGASIYSALASALDIYTVFNQFFILAAVGILPFIYILMTYETNFKRYRYYLDEKKYQYVLQKVEDNTKSYFNDRKYQ